MDLQNEILSDIEETQRCTGRTTRICDYIIQLLFAHMGQEVKILDHWNSRWASEMLAKRVLQRLELEHPMVHATVIRDNSGIYISIQDDRLKGGVK